MKLLPTYAWYLACLVAICLIGVGSAASLKDELATAQRLQQEMRVHAETFRVIELAAMQSLAEMHEAEKNIGKSLLQLETMQQVLSLSLSPDQAARLNLELRLQALEHPEKKKQ